MAAQMPRPGRCAHADLGLHRLDGTTVIAGAPDAPAARQVMLARERLAPVPVALQKSDASGAWMFSRIPVRAGEGYVVIAFDHTGLYDPVAKADLVPTPMPPTASEHP